MRKKTKSGNRGTVGRRDEGKYNAPPAIILCGTECHIPLQAYDVGVCRDGGVGESVVQELLGL